MASSKSNYVPKKLADWSKVFESNDEHRRDLARIFYVLLLKGEIVTYRKVLKKFDDEERLKGNVIEETIKITQHEQYESLKTVIFNVKSLFEFYGYKIEEIGKGQYKYLDSEPNPLEDVRRKAEVKKRKDAISKKIGKGVLKFAYQPFTGESFPMYFHPHLLMSYNNREFAIGVSQRGSRGKIMRRAVIGLDRIKGDVEVVLGKNNKGENIYFLGALDNEYDYLKDLVGPSLETQKNEKDSKEVPKYEKKTTVTIRIHSEYHYGLIKFKPFHHTQKEIVPFDKSLGYGEISIEVIPNKELRSQIRLYGPHVEIMSPYSLRKEFADEVKSMMDRYSDKNPKLN